MIPINPILFLWAARLLGYAKPRNPYAKKGEYELADHVYERRKNPESIDKTNWSPVYTPTDDTTRLKDNYDLYLSEK